MRKSNFLAYSGLLWPFIFWILFLYSGFSGSSFNLLIAFCGLLITVFSIYGSCLLLFDRFCSRGNAHKMSSELQSAIIAERNRIAQELHSYTAQSLSNALFLLSLYEKESRPEDLERIRQEIRDVIREIRVVIHNLRNEESWPLIPSLHDVIKDFKEKCEIPVSFNICGQEAHISDRAKKYLLSIVEEALNNIRKHSQATRVSIELNITLDDIIIVVSDNGQGFSLSEVEERTTRDHHFGLRFMKEKTELLGGSFFIDSRNGQGTQIKLIIPHTSE